MSDHNAEYAKRNPEEKPSSPRPEPTYVNNAELRRIDAEIQEYNNSLENLDELYSSLRPNGKVLIRCTHMETTRTDSGLIIPPVLKVKVPTQTGYGYVESRDSPWKFGRLAIIVASHNEKIYEPGSWVQVSEEILKGVSAGKDFMIHMPYIFTHHSYQSYEPPTSLQDRHYGYHLIRPDLIDAFIKS